MIEKWNEMSFEKVNLIKEIKLRSWLKASFYDTCLKLKQYLELIVSVAKEV